jgi:hypothetical protein
MDQVRDVAHNTPQEIAALAQPLRVAFTWLQLRGPAVDFDDRLAGLGYAWPLFALPALAGFGLRQARTATRARTLAPVSLLAVLTILCFALQPMRWWARYTVWLWGLGALALAVEGERVAAKRSPAAWRRLGAAMWVLVLLSGGEGLFAVCHAQGAYLAFGRVLRKGGPSMVSDVRRAVNAEQWVSPEWWALGLDRQPHVCRGAWKPDTDNANLDGVLAQLSPRPRVHVVADDDETWAAVRAQTVAYGCRDLLLLRGSPVLDSARRDPDVSVEPTVAFDPLFWVHFTRASAAERHAQPVAP